VGVLEKQKDMVDCAIHAPVLRELFEIETPSVRVAGEDEGTAFCGGTPTLNTQPSTHQNSTSCRRPG